MRSNTVLCVVIPVYRHDEFLERAMKSVHDAMLDDGSMKVVILNNRPGNSHAKDLIRIHRFPFEYEENDESLTLNKNWNRCVEIANGDWVHILHEDDKVSPGFYRAFFNALGENVSFGAFFSRHAIINEYENVVRVSELHQNSSGILKDAAALQARTNAIQPPTIIVNRSVYNQVGVFREDLKYVLDWEMWYRICLSVPAWFEVEPLALYRVHSGQGTTGLVESGDSANDIILGAEIIASYCPEPHKELARAYAGRHIRACARSLLLQGKLDAAKIQLKALYGWRKSELLNPGARVLIWWIFKKTIKQYLRLNDSV